MINRPFAGLLIAWAFSTPAFAEDLHTITMTGHGVVLAQPDVARLNAAVSTNALTAAAALSANSVRMSQVFDALQNLGIPNKDIQTTEISIFPQYTNGDSNTPRRLTGYQVSNQISVELTAVSKVGQVLDTLVNAGINQMNNIRFDISAPGPLLEKARSQAVADARKRAETYAQAAGVTLGPVISIREADSQVPPGPLFHLAAAPAAMTPIASGEQSVTADVTVVWQIH